MNAASDTYTDDDTSRLIEASAAASPAERALLEEEVVRRHLGLARHLAGRYAGRGADRDDLDQVANLALFKAVRGFNHDRGEFVPFATVTILGEIKKYFRDQCWAVRPPRRIQQLQSDIAKATERHLQDDGASPRPAVLAEELDASVSDITEAMAARGCFSPTSLDQPVRDGQRTVADTLPTEDSTLSFIEDWVTVGPLCRDLDEADRELLRLRFVEEKTQQEIAGLTGVSQMQVSRRLSKLLARLRSQAGGQAAA